MVITNQMIEAGAKGLFTWDTAPADYPRGWDGIDERSQDTYRLRAKAVLTAALQAETGEL